MDQAELDSIEKNIEEEYRKDKEALTRLRRFHQPAPPPVLPVAAQKPTPVPAPVVTKNALDELTDKLRGATR